MSVILPSHVAGGLASTSRQASTGAKGGARANLLAPKWPLVPTTATTTTTVPAPSAASAPVPVPVPVPVPTPAPKSETLPTPVSQTAAPPVPTRPEGILPPQEPPANISPRPNFLASCSGSQYDDSGGCVQAALAAIANGRQAEGLPPMIIPGNWGRLTPEEQLFVATNLERTVRGLPALTAMVNPLDLAAAAGAASNSDPAPPPGFGFVQWGSNWAGALGNPLEAIYFWMYDDGLGSSNIQCRAGDTSGCWGHRDNVLLRFSGQNLVMGVGYVGTAYRGSPSWTELLVEATGSSPVDFAG